MRLMAALTAVLLGMGFVLDAGATKPVTPEDVLERVFSEIERNLIRAYYGDRADKYLDRGGKRDKGLPPGLAKRGGDLPPGLDMQLERFGRLPPGLAQRDLPPELEARLTPLARDLRRIVVGPDVLLVQAATGIILDILRDVIR